MLLKRIGATAAVVWAAAFVAIGVGAVAGGSSDDPKRPGEGPRKQASRSAEERPKLQIPPPLREPLAGDWLLTLREALGIGLENGRNLRLLARPADGPIVVAPASDRPATPEFKAETMAMVRSIEQLYWGLAQQYAKLWAAEWAEGQTEGILGREREELKLGRATTADVAEANQRLEQCRLDLVNATTGVINIERQLRHVLGLPVADNRRIIPVTAAVEAKVEPDREASLSAMLLNQPDVVRAREKANAKHVDLDEIVRTLLPDLAPRKTTVPPYTPPRKKSISLGSVELEQVVQQATHTLSRFLLEVETDYEQYQTAKRIRNAADERLAAQRAYYKEGRITIDRLLDAVKQYADAVAQEAQFKADYNIAIVALEEAKGTLLENDKISLVEAPSTGAAGVVDAGAAAAAEPTAAPEPVGRAKPAEPQGRTMAFEATIRVGAIPIEIRGSVTVGPAAAVDSEGR